MTRRWVAASALAIVGCMNGKADAGLDAPEDAPTLSTPIDATDVSPSSALDASEDAFRLQSMIDATADASPLSLEGLCTYVDYGSTCEVACDVPPDVPIRLRVVWSGPYCCHFAPYESFEDCRCEGGRVLCSNGYRDMRTLPASTCEFCPGTPSGWASRPDAASPDAGPDAPEPSDAPAPSDAPPPARP